MLIIVVFEEGRKFKQNPWNIPQDPQPPVDEGNRSLVLPCLGVCSREVLQFWLSFFFGGGNMEFKWVYFWC